MNRQEKIQLTLMILIAIFIATMIFLIVYLTKNVDEIKSDPIEYGMDKRDFNACSCVASDGQSVVYRRTGGGGDEELFNPKS